MLYGGMVKDRRLFAKDAVRFEGDIVAGVAATTAEIAEQAAALIEVDYEPLPVVTDFEAALADDATLVHPEWASYEARRGARRATATRSATRRSSRATPTRRWPSADVVVKGRYVTDPVQGVPIEPRAVVAQWQGDRVTVWTSTQVPYAARAGVADTLQIPESHVRVDRAAARRRLRGQVRLPLRGARRCARPRRRRPVKLVFSRREEFFAVGHRREGMVIELETGARADGTLVARRARLVLDKGAYCGEGGFFAQMAAMHALGPVRARERPHRVVARLLEQPAVVVDPRADRAAGLLGARAAHGRARRGARAGSGGAPPPHADRGGLGDRDGPGARADRDEGDARAGGRADRLRRRSCPTTRRSASRAAGGRASRRRAAPT